MKRKTGVGQTRVLWAILAFLSAGSPPARAADPAGRDCKISGVLTKDDYVLTAHPVNDWDASCFYDAAGDLVSWLIYLKAPAAAGAYRYTVITGLPAVKARQVRYNSAGGGLNRLAYCMDWKAERNSPFVPSGRDCGDWDLTTTLDRVFEPWTIDLESYRFPPESVRNSHGELNLRTVRIPLYDASGMLVRQWTSFWQDCLKETPPGKTFSGCQADFREYIAAGSSAGSVASLKSYPSRSLAVRAGAIAQAVGAAQRFHEITLELVPLTLKWKETSAESDHLEPSDLPPGIVDRLEAAERALNSALANVDLIAATL